MGNEVQSNNNENIPGKPNEDFSAGKIKVIERYLIISMFILIGSLLLITLDQLLLAGCFIIGSASLGIIVFRKVLLLNSKYIESINSFLKTDSRKDKIITDFSHKIREPLNNLVITGDILIDSNPNSKQKELLETFIASTKSMVNTVNELTMESAENMSYESRKQIRFNILSAIEHVIELYKLKDRINIRFTLTSRESGNMECIGDPVIFKQIFLDIISRIEKQSIDRTTRVSISIEADKGYAGESLLSITVETDISMFLIDEMSSEGSHAARLILLSKGKYSQETGQNFTKLKIFLPIKSAVAEPKQKVPPTKIEELIRKERTRKELKDLRVLLVEDNLINQKITLLTLKPLVLSIDSVTNGKEALDRFGTNNYDLVLMDIQMPVMNGLTATEKIRALESATNSHVPIIAITANAMIGDKEKCLSSGADDYISKPFQPVQLVEKIKQVI
jgi:CheY-like chemotaxis protein